jgi:zinc/manganese transport system substrate-binding protein
MKLTSRVAFVVAVCMSTLAAAAQPPLNVVAAENFYGDVARQIGGEHVSVTSILSNPEQDPHLFEASPSVGKALTSARLVVYNGVDYDPWMEKLLSASKAPGRHTLVAGELLHKKSGDNPHLWYDPATMPAVARQLAKALEGSDPAHKTEYEKNLQSFLAELKPVDDKIKAIRTRYAGTPVTATEPVFGYMAQALGFSMRNERFQLAVMNDTEPSASDIAAFENDLKNRKVKILFYNSQASNAAASHMQDLAKQAGVAVVGVTETAPGGKTYQDWMLDQLDAVEKALSPTAQ